MLLLHTSDWHLGRTLHGIDLLDAQRATLRHIIEVARDRAVSAVLVSGDVYDRSVPPVEAVTLFEETLRELASFTTVIVTSGNHDSAIRLGFGADLFEPRVHVHTRVEPERIARPVELVDEHGPVLVFPLPWLEPDVARHRLADGEPLRRTHEAVMGAALDIVRTSVEKREAETGSSVRSVVLAHAFVGHVGTRPEGPAQLQEPAPVDVLACDSERDIAVGGVAIVPSSVFEGISYTALGHLHGPQQPRLVGEGLVRYSGSPLRYSFSEASHEKSVTLVQLDADGVAGIELVPVPQPRAMAILTGTLETLLADPAHTLHEDAWVKAVVIDAVRPELLQDRLRERFPHLLVTEHQPAGGPVDLSRVGPGTAVDPLEVVARFVAATGRDATPDELALIRAVYESVRNEEVGA
jgi:exonuclease SbcD